jgi:hypothetical protein
MEKVKCKAIIDQGPNKGNQCNRSKLNNSNYCGKHNKRYTIINEAKTKNLRICDDGKRSCKNYTENDNGRSIKKRGTGVRHRPQRL